MALDYETILREALELHPAERAKLVDELARSLAREAGISEQPLLSDETARHIDARLERSRQLEDARIEAALDKARKRREGQS